jgi:ankyrin repeat protein
VAGRWTGAIAAAAVLLAAVPLQAQQRSDWYTFLDAVKKRDGDKATSLIVAPASTVINKVDPSTGEGALHILTRERDLTWLSFMLGKRADPDVPNKQGSTALAIAAQIGWIEGADLLLRTGARVDRANNRGETPLILAVHNRDVPMARLLVSGGANPNWTDSVAGYSALDYARQDNRASALVKILETAKPATRKVSGPGL